MTRGSVILLAVTVALAAGAGGAVALAGPDSTSPQRAAEFHRLVGGVGGGPATDLSRCEAVFDPPRTPDGGPVPGGEFFYPDQGHAPSD